MNKNVTPPGTTQGPKTGDEGPAHAEEKAQSSFWSIHRRSVSTHEHVSVKHAIGPLQQEPLYGHQHLAREEILQESQFSSGV